MLMVLAMKNFLRNPCFLIISMFLVCFYFPSLCSSTTQFSSCLINHKVNNFTTFPSNENESKTYYDLLNFSINNLRFFGSSVPKPKAIVLPGNMDELIGSIICSREAMLEIRTRCGGHSYEGTSSVATDGSPFVIIDMMNLNRISIDLETETAWVEGGATLGETYYAISKASGVHGFSAGSCPTVGVGGHIGGGGFGLLSRKYGLAADNVIDAILIDSEGRWLNREAMGEDVFWAIRGGGGGNWGIVYAWKIKLLEVPGIVTCFTVSRPGNKEQVARLVHKWQSIAPNLEESFYLSTFVGANLPETDTIDLSATFKGLFLGPRSQAVSILTQVFPELGFSEGDCKEMSWIQSVLFFSGLRDGAEIAELKNRSSYKHFYKGKSDYVRNAISLDGIDQMLNILEKEPKGYVILDPYGGMMQNISSDSIAFPHREGNLFTIQYLVEWHEEDNEQSGNYIAWVRDFYNSMTPYVSSGPRAAYINYIDLDLGIMELINTSDGPRDAAEIARKWGEKYFLGNYERLVRAKTLIDPHNVFKNQQGIPPMDNDAIGESWSYN